MLLRRPSDDAPLVAERMRTVLTGVAVPPPGGGWVPGPEEPGLPPEPVEPVEAPAPLLTPRPLDEDRRAPEPAPASGPPAALLRLPAVLAAGRLDPGRRGAVALVVAALLAASTTGLVVLRDRPREVVAPDVVASGVPLPGVSPASDGAAVPGAAPAGPVPPGAATSPAEVVVAVAGKVVRPGLVRLPSGSRVDDAVRAAGGPLPGVGTGLLNLARLLVDGEQVLVGVDPPPGAPVVPGAAAGAPATSGGLLDLNAATADDLDGLPGIGPVLAQRIVDWRTEHGRFASVEQLREVTGIGESKYADLEPKVTVP